MPTALAELAAQPRSTSFREPSRPRVLLDGEDVSDAIRTPEISMGASTVSSVPAVRRVLVRLQQELGRRAGGVLEGRDIGTKVFPEHAAQVLPRRTARGARRAAAS